MCNIAWKSRPLAGAATGWAEYAEPGTAGMLAAGKWSDWGWLGGFWTSVVGFGSGSAILCSIAGGWYAAAWAIVGGCGGGYVGRGTIGGGGTDLKKRKKTSNTVKHSYNERFLGEIGHFSTQTNPVIMIPCYKEQKITGPELFFYNRVWLW